MVKQFGIFMSTVLIFKPKGDGWDLGIVIRANHLQLFASAGLNLAWGEVACEKFAAYLLKVWLFTPNPST